MSLAADRGGFGQEFFVDDVSTGVHASGFGHFEDGRSFAFHTERRHLVIEVYRPRLPGPVPQEEDVIAVATHPLINIDLTDERSIIAAVRDAVATAQPVARAGRRISD